MKSINDNESEAEIKKNLSFYGYDWHRVILDECHHIKVKKIHYFM
jgi:superfamily II DNA or RNA helicase